MSLRLNLANFWYYPMLMITILFLPIFIFPQQSSSLKTTDAVIQFTQKIYGPDDLLVNGRLYIPDHLKAEGNPYFEEEKWTTGRIIIKGKSFDNIEFIYNIAVDRIVIQSKDINQNNIAVLLNRNFIDDFYIGEHHFINVDQLNLISIEKGFAEEIYRSGLTFVIRYKKDFLNQYSQSNPYGSYSKLQSTKYIQKGNQLVKLPTRKSFLVCFKPFQNQIKKYFRSNNISYKNASKEELSGLLKFCDGLVK
jgi:hypothetical protein